MADGDHETDEARLRQQMRTAHKRLGANIRRAREHLGLSQEDLALQARCGGVRRLARMEAGRRCVPVLTLEKLARALGMSAKDLLAGVNAEAQ
jgi:transcriptional regulator with XRE-family HTH domain